MNKIAIDIMCSKPYKMMVCWLPRFAYASSILFFVVTLYLFPNLPNKVPTHIDVLGNADAYGNKFNIFIFAFLPFACGYLLKIIEKRYMSLFYTGLFILITFFSTIYIGHMYLTMI
jgi:uncharacterized membrane protein